MARVSDDKCTGGIRLQRKEERDLIRGCLEGNQASWRQLYQRHQGEARAVLFRILGPVADLDDLVQTVFVKVYRTLDRFEGRSKLSTWLYRICVHVAMDHLRIKKRQKATVGLENAPPQADPRADPSEVTEMIEDILHLQKALTRIKDPKRTVLVLHDLMEVPTEEIASMQNAPIPTVRSRLFYARRELARALKHVRRRAKGAKR
jgi:RNA polymerase sigma-70 factor (ECF subfamily)